MTVASGQHFNVGDREQLGFFEKAPNPIPDYGEVCRDGERGFLGEFHNAHHILPATSFKKAMAELSAAKQEYIRSCQHITPWNINSAQNLIGLPELRAFVLAWEMGAPQGKAAVQRITDAKARIGDSGLDKRKADVRRANPENHPVHIPTNWGHRLYDIGVGNEIRTQIWQTLDEQKPSHDVDAQKIADAVQALQKKFLNHLNNRGVGAKKTTWDARAEGWFKSFTMWPGANPLVVKRKNNKK